jgi:uroporphyrinogen decarboxylase
MILERLLGYENLFLLSHDEPELVESVFEQWGKKVYEFYQEAVRYPEVGAIFHGDDLGYKTGTMLSPDFLRRNVFPWFKKYASLAHQEGKMFWLHSCGNLTEIMEDLIEDVGIDALHSFEDGCCSVMEYKRRYGERIGILGGIDMDKLVRMNESELRGYVREILDECMPDRYALGSGNTVANYIPVKNYLIMLDEGSRWQAKNN